MTQINAPNLLNTLEFAFLSGGFTTRSDFARKNSEIIAVAAQGGLLTTNTPRDGFGNVWRLTAIGNTLLFGGVRAFLNTTAPAFMVDTNGIVTPTAH